MNNAIAAKYIETVSARVKANGHTGWGGADSLAVVEAVCDEAYGSEEGFDAAREVVAEVINPSAFRQKLEKLPADHAMHVKKDETVKRGNGGGLAAAMAILNTAAPKA